MLHDPEYRERYVVDLLQRVCTVSVETVRIVDELGQLTAIDQDPEP